MLDNQFLAHFSNKEIAYDPCMYPLLLYEYFEEIDECWWNLVCTPCQQSLSLTLLPFRTDIHLSYIWNSIPASQITRSMPIIKICRFIVLREVSDMHWGTHTNHPLWVEWGFLMFQRVMHVDTTGLYSVHMLTLLSTSVDHCLVKV